MMLDIQARQKWLRENAEMLETLAESFEQNAIAEHDARYAEWISHAKKFSGQFRRRAKIYDGLGFRKAHSDDDLRDAASYVANLFRWVFNRHETKNQFIGKPRPDDVNLIKSEHAWSEEIDFIFNATEKKEAAENV